MRRRVARKVRYDGPLWGFLPPWSCPLRFVIFVCPRCGLLKFIVGGLVVCRECAWLSPVGRALWNMGLRPAPVWWPVKKGPLPGAG